MANIVAWDLSDTRYADQLALFDQDIVFGVSLNNAPTVQDLWNTTPVWGFPYATSPLAPTPGATSLIDGPLMTTAGGGSMFAMIDQLLYLDLGAYTTFSKGAQKGRFIPAIIANFIFTLLAWYVQYEIIGMQ